MKAKSFYVTNKELMPEMIRFRKTGVMTEMLGRMIMQISTNLSSKANFANYSWRRDMVGEALLTCCKYAKSFNPAKSKNPFAYLTQICRNSFLAYIKKQNRHSVIKDKCVKGARIFQEDSYVAKAIDYERIMNN